MRRRRVGAIVGLAAWAAALTALAIVGAPGRQNASGQTTAGNPRKDSPPPTTVAPAHVSAVPIDGTASSAPVFSRIPTSDPVVFLTIDDGIVQDPAVIDYIRAQRIPVTMFPVLTYVKQNEAFFQALHALGATAQDRTLHHSDLTKLSVADQRMEICGPLDEYEREFGVRPWIFRPPYGSMNADVPLVARSCGIRAIVLWKASTNDGRLDTQGGPLQPGDIILMHFRADLRRNLEVALNTIKAAGLRAANLADYLTSGSS